MGVVTIRCCCYRSYENKAINYNEMMELINKYPVTIIDVRSKQEYLEGHLNGAINIPLCDINRRISSVVSDKNSYIVVYCSAGYRSMKAQKFLIARGYSNVYNLVDKI